MNATATRTLPYAPLTTAELRRRADVEFALSGRWVAQWLRNDLTIAEHRHAWASAEKHAGAGMTVLSVVHIRERGEDRP